MHQRKAQWLAAGALLPLAALLLLSGCRSFWARGERSERPPFRRVSPAIAFEILRDSPEILVLDLRSPQAFNGETGHIYRAQNIPLDRLPFRLLEISAWREETFLVYCDTPQCAEAGMGILISSGYEDAILMDGGIDGWIAQGFKTVLPEAIAGRRPGETIPKADDSVAPGEGGPSSTPTEEAAPPPPR